MERLECREPRNRKPGSAPPSGPVMPGSEARSSGLFHACEPGPIHFPAVLWECPNRSAGCNRPSGRGVRERPGLTPDARCGGGPSVCLPLPSRAPLALPEAPSLGLLFLALRTPAPPWPGKVGTESSSNLKFPISKPSKQCCSGRCLPVPLVSTLVVFLPLGTQSGLQGEHRSPAKVAPAVEKGLCQALPSGAPDHSEDPPKQGESSLQKK